jgi:hypothetical protein
VRLPWQQNVTAELHFPLRGIHAPPMAHMPLEAFEAQVRAAGGDEWHWCASLPTMLAPLEEGSQVVYAFESYTEWTEVTPAMDHGVESSTTITFPPLSLTYHYSTVHRVWDYIMGSMLGAHFDAAIPYLGSHEVVRKPSQGNIFRRCRRTAQPFASSYSSYSSYSCCCMLPRLRRLPLPLPLPFALFPRTHALTLALLLLRRSPWMVYARADLAPGGDDA